MAAVAASGRTSPAPANTTRRVVPIKRADGEPLTRADLQFDFLNTVFSDSNAVFTNPYAPPPGMQDEGGRGGEDLDKITFAELYTNAIVHSSKATKVLKETMRESPAFAMDFSMLALLVNVGRVNTTMSFFPATKTSIRTYHPIPALSRTDGNLQDAPRIKHVLKHSFLQTDVKSLPATPGDILTRCKSGKRPSTSVTNLIFILAHHTGPIGQIHFDGHFTFLDLFLRADVSSASRARVFLWLCFNYLESPVLDDKSNEDTNPFSGPKKRCVPPPLTPLTPEEMSQENQETAEDIATTNRLQTQRSRLVQPREEPKESTTIAGDDADDATAFLTGEDVKVKSKQAKGKQALKDRVILTHDKSKTKEPIMLLPDLDDDDEMIDAFVKKRSSRKNVGVELFQHPSSLSALRSQHRVASDTAGSRNRYSPYTYQSSSYISSFNDLRSRNRRHQPRSMLQQAWHVISSTDPLVDSDEESGGDENMREDYLRRLEVITRLSQQHWPQESSYPAKMELDPL